MRKTFTFDNRLDMSLPYLYNLHLAQDLKFIVENIVLKKFPEQKDGYIPRDNPNPNEACEGIKTQLAGFTRREIKRHIYAENTVKGIKFILGIIAAFVLSIIMQPATLLGQAPLWVVKYTSPVFALIGVALIASYIIWKKEAAEQEKKMKRIALSEAGKEYMDQKTVEIINVAAAKINLSPADFGSEYNNSTAIKINDCFEARYNDKFLFFRILGNIVGYHKENIQALTYAQNYNYFLNSRESSKRFVYNHPFVVIHKTGIVEGYSFEQQPYLAFHEGQQFINGPAVATGVPIINNSSTLESKPISEICNVPV